MLQNLLEQGRRGSGKASWLCLFGLMCWKLWTARNLAWFEKKQITPTNLVREVVLYAGFSEQVAGSCGLVGGRQRKQERTICWARPPNSHVTLNCDGALKLDSRMAGAGCLLRDHDGGWRMGCCRNIGVCTSLQAELWALMDGLELAWSAGYKDIIVQMDCLVAVRIIRNQEGGPNAQTSIARRIQRLLQQDWRVTVTHVYREGNRCTNFLASYALSLGVRYHCLLEPPDGIVGLLREDADGVGRARLCCINS